MFVFGLLFAFFFAKVIVIFQRVAEPSSESYKKSTQSLSKSGAKVLLFFGIQSLLHAKIRGILNIIILLS